MIQHTLTGEETDRKRVRPDTLKKCYHCEEYVLRSRWDAHEAHNREAEKRISVRIAKEAEDEEDDKPEQVGEWFDVRIHKTVEYAFRIPAWDKHRAKELAEEWAWDASPVDSYAVHTDIDSRGTITTEDVPDDFDPYGGTELWEVFEAGEDDDLRTDGGTVLIEGHCPCCGTPFAPGDYRCEGELPNETRCGKDLVDVEPGGGTR